MQVHWCIPPPGLCAQEFECHLDVHRGPDHLDEVCQEGQLPNLQSKHGPITVTHAPHNQKDTSKTTHTT